MRKWYCIPNRASWNKNLSSQVDKLAMGTGSISLMAKRIFQVGLELATGWWKLKRPSIWQSDNAIRWLTRPNYRGPRTLITARFVYLREDPSAKKNILQVIGGTRREIPTIFCPVSLGTCVAWRSVPVSEEPLNRSTSKLSQDSRSRSYRHLVSLCFLGTWARERDCGLWPFLSESCLHLGFGNNLFNCLKQMDSLLRLVFGPGQHQVIFFIERACRRELCCYEYADESGFVSELTPACRCSL